MLSQEADELLALREPEERVACVVDGAGTVEWYERDLPMGTILYLNPPSQERDLETFWHEDLPDILAQVSAGLLDPFMAHALIHKAIEVTS